MKPKSCHVENFGSYESADFDFANQGLTLINGVTGSGKSSLCDFAAWTLYGETSKGGSVEDVKSWGSTEPTKGILELETANGDELVVTRIRGRPSQNDLYFTVNNGDKVRGKDIIETQKLLNDKLGVDATTFNIASYYSQFSDADKFFTAKAKDRREILERITDLALPVKISEKASEVRKTVKKALEEKTQEKSRLEGALQAIKNQCEHMNSESKKWEANKRAQIADLSAKWESFEDDKAREIRNLRGQIDDLTKEIVSDEEFVTQLDLINKEKEQLKEHKEMYNQISLLINDLKRDIEDVAKESKSHQDNVCNACKRPIKKGNPALVEELRNKQSSLEADFKLATEHFKEVKEKLAKEALLDKAIGDVNFRQRQNGTIVLRMSQRENALKLVEEKLNIYELKLQSVQESVNPYTSTLQDLLGTGVLRQLDVAKANNDLAALTKKITTLTTIYDLSFVMRAEMLRTAVEALQDATNDRLTRFFDSEFKVEFLLEDTDKLVVKIYKDIHECSFNCLSGGQRRLLTLCFTVALMKAIEEAAGIRFSVRMFDESLNGIDEELKNKAFRLFEELAGTTESVFLIDHSESLKSLFDKQYLVTNSGGSSVIEEVA